MAPVEHMDLCRLCWVNLCRSGALSVFVALMEVIFNIWMSKEAGGLCVPVGLDVKSESVAIVIWLQRGLPHKSVPTCFCEPTRRMAVL